ncbi:tail length tape-measure protein [Aeromonas phage 85AhydR10PP]|nr:tail length tape-measure protein [Aeromonas phage 85AhydR10PP]
MAKDNKRLQFIMDMVDKISAPAQKVNKSLQGMGKEVTDSQKKLASLNKQAGDISKLAAMRGELERNTKTSKEMAERVQKLKMQMLLTEKPTKAMKDNFRAATKEQSEQLKMSDKHKQALDKLTQSLAKSGVDINRLGESERRTRIQIAQTNTTLRDQQKALDGTTRKQEQLTKAKEAYAKAEAAAGKMAGGGAKMAAGGTALMAANYAAGSPFRDFDAQMSAVQATGAMDDATKQRLAKLAREEAKISAWGATDAASAQEYLAMAGFDEKAINNSLRGVMNLASATKTGLAETADIGTNILGGFGLDPSEMARVGDILTKVTSSANTNLTELGGAMKYVAPVAKSAGYEIESVAAAAGMLANVGIKDSQAGTALRAAITRMATLPKAAKAAFDELNVATTDAAGNMRPLEEVLMDVAKATDGMGSGKKTALIAQMFGVEASAGLGELLAKSTGAELEAYIEKVRNSKGATDTAAATRLKNLDGDIKTMLSGVEELQLKWGESFNMMYRGVVRFATGVIAWIDEWMAKNPRMVKAIGLVVTVLGAVGAVMGTLIMVMAPLVIGWAKLRLVMWMWNTVASKVLLSIWGVIKGIVMMAWNVTSFLVRGALMVAWFILSRTVMAAWNIACAAMRGIMVALTAAQWLWNAALTANPIGAVIMAVVALVAAGVWLYQNWERLPEIFSNLWAKIVEFVGFDPMAAITGAWDAVGTYFTELFGGIWDSFMSVFGKIGDKLSSFGSWATGGFGMFDDELKEQVTDAPKPGSDPVVKGKPATKGNQVRPVAPVQNNDNSVVHLQITTQPGQDNEAIAREVARQLAEAKRKDQQQQRARNKD